jgi:hypothetical protein
LPFLTINLVWSSQIDQPSGKVYYYNRITGKSEWKKPKGFDGYDLKERIDNEYTRTFKTFTATPLEEPKPVGAAIVGKWEEVDPEDDFFKKNAVKNEEEENHKDKFHSSKLGGIKYIDVIPEGEIVGELDSDIDKYSSGSPNHERIKKRDLKSINKEYENDDNKLLNTKDQLAILRNKIDKGIVDEGFRKLEFSSISKPSGKLATFKKKKKGIVKNKKRKVLEESDGDDE